MDKKYKNFEFPTGRAIIIVVSFLLAVYDMFFLYKALKNVVGTILGDSTQSMIFMVVALLLASIANTCALLWGIENGKHMQKRSINKYSIGCFLGWFAIGVGYLVIRLFDLRETISIAATNGSEANIAGSLISIGLLAVSYIGTGTLIQASAREIFDAELSALRKAKKRFERANEDLADSYADIKESIGVLKSYDINYKTLNVQYKKCLTSMIRTENATMSVIVGRMLARHGDVNPKLADDILKSVIKDRDEKWLEREVAQSVKRV